MTSRVAGPGRTYDSTDQSAQPKRDAGLAAWSGKYLSAAAVLLLLAVLSVVAVDRLASGISHSVRTHEGSWWWGSREESYWADVVAKNGLRTQSRDLVIRISGDTLTARYTVTAPADSVLAARVSAAQDGQSGDDLVNNVLGAVQIAEFRYGVTGSQQSFGSLTFRAPQVSVVSRRANITIESDPLQLYFRHQYILVDKPPGVTVTGKDRAHVTAPSVQIADISGAAPLDDTVKHGVIDTANLNRSGRRMSATVSENGPVQGWLDGLRRTGGITIPLANGPLNRLNTLFLFLVMLWALDGAKKVYDRWPEVAPAVAVARKAVVTVVTGLAFVAFIGFAFDVSTTLLRDQNAQGYVAAGPLGLLLGGAAFAWPVACYRVGSVSQPGNAQPGLAWFARLRLWWKAALLAAVAHAVVVFLYWLALHLVLRINPFTRPQVLVGTVAVTVLVSILALRLMGRPGTITWLVSAAMVAAALAATIAWPVLWYNGLYLERSHVHVNIIGKWIFITIAVLVVAGLCIMSWRVLRVLMGKDRLWKRAVAVAILVGIGVAVLPDAAAKAQLANPHATGMVPVDLFDLFDALPDLLYWMLLGLAIVVVMRLPSEPDLRPVRRIAIPIAVLLLYWNGSWLYLPITFLIGLLLVSWLALPEKLAEAPRPCTADEALSKTTATLKNVLADWRAADFAAGQRQALAASSTDALQDLLVQNDREGYDRSFAAMTDAQEKLANEHDRHQRDALTAKAQVFSHKEDTPNTATARCGTFTGAVLGIVPAAVTILITPPPWDSDGYPVLNFVGSTAWNLFFWIILGWFVGYFLPLIRGNNGTEKALWLFVVGVAATLPMSVMWDDGHAWMLDIIAYLELFIFLMVTTVILCDLCTLRNSGMRLTDWVRVQNWRFVITWSTALIAAIGTAAITVLSTVAVDLTSHALTNEGTSQQASQTGQTGR